jgi:hypothetical protein
MNAEQLAAPHFMAHTVIILNDHGVVVEVLYRGNPRIDWNREWNDEPLEVQPEQAT